MKKKIKNIYFNLETIDSTETKYIYFDGQDYNKLEKMYVRNFGISIKDIDTDNNLPHNELCNIGCFNVTYFDYKTALNDNVNIREILEAEGDNSETIYNIVISDFNKGYYSYFGDDSRENISYISDFIIDSNYQNDEILGYIIRNIHKIIYQLTGLNTGTLLLNKGKDNLNFIQQDICSKFGYLSVDSNKNYWVKNIAETKEDISTVNFNDEFVSRFKKFDIEQSILEKIRS